jgi:hypothetical protein
MSTQYRQTCANSRLQGALGAVLGAVGASGVVAVCERHTRWALDGEGHGSQRAVGSPPYPTLPAPPGVAGMTRRTLRKWRSATAVTTMVSPPAHHTHQQGFRASKADPRQRQELDLADTAGWDAGLEPGPQFLDALVSPNPRSASPLQLLLPATIVCEGVSRTVYYTDTQVTRWQLHCRARSLALSLHGSEEAAPLSLCGYGATPPVFCAC